jgi:enoyl-CoA hydratase
MSEILQIENFEGWTQLTINRPAQRNALSSALLGEIALALGNLSEERGCRVVLITGADGHFAAGADISEIENKTSAEALHDPRKSHWASIRSFPKPLVAAVDGFCLGGGLELALMADCLVLGASAKLGLPETNLGLIPGAGGAERLTARIGVARAMRMVLTGEVINAKSAYDWGLAGWLCEGTSLQEAQTLATRLADRAPLALNSAKAAVLAAVEGNLLGGLPQSRAAFELLLDSADKREGIAAFREKRQPRFTGL